MRKVSLERKTGETTIAVDLCLDGQGKTEIDTGVGFFDHMLTLVGKHGFLDLTVKAQGDLQVDAHHTVEDCGIVFGGAIREALADKEGINRYGNAFVPMDESLAQVSIDLSGRPYLVFNADFPKIALGNFDLELIEEFFQAVAVKADMTLHINLLYGSNTHHMAEAIFKAFARALAQAVAKNEKIQGVLSTKGVL